MSYLRLRLNFFLLVILNVCLVITFVYLFTFLSENLYLLGLT
jgi:hypothetical protein